MATTNERVSVLETKVDGIRDDLSELRKENRQDHAVVMQKLDNLRDLKNYILGACGLAGIIIAWIVAHIDWHSLLSNAIK
jgi:septation ring formation regulator EzrA